MASRRALVAFLCVAIAMPQLVITSIEAIAANTGTTTRVSVSSTGVQANAESRESAVSGDGRYVAFMSEASNLVEGDTNGHEDVFVHDTATDTTVRVSVSSAGTQADGDSANAIGVHRQVAISGDGRLVAFDSCASNLVEGDTNARWDVFVHDTASGETTRVSVASDGTQGDSGSLSPSISADGRYVAFHSTATNLAPGEATAMDYSDVLVHDMETGITTRIDADEDGMDIAGESTYPSISADGTYVAFLSTYGLPRFQKIPDVYVYDRSTSLTTLVSIGLDDEPAVVYDSSPPSISADGRFVAFTAGAAVPPDATSRMGVFLRDTLEGSTSLVSVTSDGVRADGSSDSPSISGDGRYVAFRSEADNLAPSAEGPEVYIHDSETGYTVCVSDPVTTGNSHTPSISADGRYIAFTSTDSALVPGDTNGCADVFVQDTAAADNTPPTARSDAYSVTEDVHRVVPRTAGVLANDEDADGDPLVPHRGSGSSGPDHGTLYLSNDGSFGYTPAPDFSGTDSFTYRTWDGAAYSEWTTVTIEVTPVPDAPVAIGDTYTTGEDATLTVEAPGVLLHDLDVDGDDIAADRTGATDPLHGTVDMNADGSFTYTPDADYHGTDVFTYRAWDGTYYSAFAAVTITIDPVNDAPVADDEVYSMPEDGILTVAAPGVLEGDTDVDGDELSADRTGTSGPHHGTLAVNADGSFVYRPSQDYFGTDSFTYRASDGTASSDPPATVTITIEDVPESLSLVPVAGDTRIDTAIAASKKAFPDGATTVVISTAFNWPDALGGAALAGALDGPILLTAPTSLPRSVLTEIGRLKAAKAVVLGSDAAVSRDVERALNDRLGDANVSRVEGANRYETARAIARKTVGIMRAEGGYDGTCFVATGGNFPDALGASPLAAARGWPIYLVNPAGLDAATISAMRSDGVTHALVLGSSVAVSTRIERDLASRVPCTVTRLEGDDRYGTAAAVAGYGVANAGLGWNRLAIATGQDFPDALAGGVLQGKTGSVMLLTPTARLHAEVARVLKSNKASIHEVRFLGGSSAVSVAVRKSVSSVLE